VTRPVLELKAFRRVHLRPAEKTTVDLKLTSEALSLLGPDMKPVVEPGAFDLFVGSSSGDTTRVTLQVAPK
jgi:beta-glucosidase